MAKDENLSLLCQQYIKGSAKDRTKLLSKVAAGGEAAISSLMKHLCELSVDTKRKFPDHSKLDVAKKTGNPELIKKANDAELLAYMPVGQPTLQPAVKAFADALVLMYKNADDDVLEALERQVEHNLSTSNRTSWAMALVLVEAASDLGDIAIHWIKAGYDKTGTPGNRTSPQMVYSMIYNMVNARAGDKSAKESLITTAGMSKASPDQFQTQILKKAYAHFVGS